MKFDWAALLDRINARYQAALEKEGTVEYQELQNVLESAVDLLREHIQELTEGAIKRVVDKLDTDEPLSPVEIAQARLWMVGDADAYLQLESRYGNWLRELENTLEAINHSLLSGAPDLGEAVRLQTTVKSCLITMPALLHYRAQKERVRHFENMVKRLEGGTRKMIKMLLEEKMKSE